jgi:hypothetical protein
MNQSHFREQADACRRLARESTDSDLQERLRKQADEYQMLADEPVGEKIGLGLDPNVDD